jgi:arylsulfatase
MGRYVNRDKESTWGNYDWGPTIGEVLQQAGYRTLWVGKNHSKIRPPERGFDRFHGFQGGACSFWNPGNKLRDGGAFPHSSEYEWMIDDEWIQPFVPEDPNYYMTDAFTDQALAWLEDYHGEEQPFFLYLAYNSPHWPLHAKPADIATYRGRYDGGYQAIQAARYQRMIDHGLIDAATCAIHPNDITDWHNLSPAEQAKEAERMAIHAAMVDNLDQNIGRVLAHLKAAGKWDNTIILFLSDNGASHEDSDYLTKRAFKHYQPRGDEEPGSVMTYEAIGLNWALVANTPFARHKSTSREGGVCTPLVIHYPAGISAGGGFVDTPAHLVDVLPTALALAGAEYPKTFNGSAAKPLDGVSLVPSFNGAALSERPTPIGFDFGAGQGLRDGPWKLVKDGGTAGKWMLFNLDEDRSACHDLSSHYPERVQAMSAAFDAWHVRNATP